MIDIDAIRDIQLEFAVIAQRALNDVGVDETIGAAALLLANLGISFKRTKAELLGLLADAYERLESTWGWTPIPEGPKP